jgi:hypothetical protein
MNIFNWRPKTITLDDQRSVLIGRRDPATGQSVLRTETDAETHRRFIAEFVASVKPDGMIEIQLARRLAQDSWRIALVPWAETSG